MKRKIFSILLAAVLLFLCGCGSSTNTDSTGGTSAAGTDIYRQKVEERLAEYEFKPPYEGKPWIEYDPDRRVYINLGGQDCDFYPGTDMDGSYLTFLVVSLDSYDTSEIQVEIPIQTEYKVEVTDVSALCRDTLHQNKPDGQSAKMYALTEPQYLCMTDTDFREREQLEAYESIAFQLMEELKANAAKEQIPLEEVKASEEYQFYNTMRSEAKEKLQEVEKQFLALTEKDLPQFYAYWVNIHFPGLGSYEETAESLTVIVGQQRYEMNIGQWRFHTQTPQAILDAREAESIYGTGGCVAMSMKYDDRPIVTEYEYESFRFTATDGLTVTGVKLLDTPGSAAKVLAGRVRVYEKGALGGNVLVMEHLWDTKTPLEFEDGQTIQIELCIWDDRLKNYQFGFTSYRFLECTYRGELCAYYTENLQHRIGHPWDIYLMAFQGVDVGEYYHYHPRADWHQDIPAEWLS